MSALFTGIILRHLLSGAGAALIAKGITDASAWEAISGGIMAAVALVTSYINKKRLTKE